MKLGIRIIYSLSEAPIQGGKKEIWYKPPSMTGILSTADADANDKQFTLKALEKSLLALLECHDKVWLRACRNHEEHVKSVKLRNDVLYRWDEIRIKPFTLGAFMGYVDAMRKLIKCLVSGTLTICLDRDRLLAAGMDETASLLSECVENADSMAAHVTDSLIRQVTYMHAMDEKLYRMYEGCLGLSESADIKIDADKDNDVVPQRIDMTAEGIILICKTMLRNPVHDRDGARIVEMLLRLENLLHGPNLRFSNSKEDGILVYLREWDGVGNPEYELLLHSKAPEVFAYALPLI